MLTAIQGNFLPLPPPPPPPWKKQKEWVLDYYFFPGGKGGGGVGVVGFINMEFCCSFCFTNLEYRWSRISLFGHVLLVCMCTASSASNTLHKDVWMASCILCCWFVAVSFWYCWSICCWLGMDGGGGGGGGVAGHEEGVLKQQTKLCEHLSCSYNFTFM